jgi:hypothetical protein
VWSWQYGFILFPLALISIAWNWRHRDIWFLGAMLFLLALFWLGFTHLQSRFLILIVPICALLIARLRWFIGIAIAAQAVIAFIPLHREFKPHLDQFGQYLPEVIGTESLELMVPRVVDEQVPPNAVLVLIGDGKAFCYQRPMSHLRYRTIFDADTSDGRGVIDAWAADAPASAWLLVDPNELRRFESYQPFPPLPPEISDRREPYLIHR